ncbi:MAG: MinD/ParA family protein [Candidatus Wallbacteria bacterium]|nr:MinD/ParA family protein [Candidatus Wallbacteria bacterium]
MTLPSRNSPLPEPMIVPRRRDPGPQLRALPGVQPRRGGMENFPPPALRSAPLPQPPVAPAPMQRARVITVTSGKGGVGKSSLVANLAVAMTRLGKSVLAFDADLGMANLDVLFGVRPQYTLYHVLKGKRDLPGILVGGPPGVKFIAGGSGMAELADLDPATMETLLASLRRLETYSDVLLIDTGAGLSRNVLSFVRAADEVLLVTTPEPTAMADAYGVLKTLALEGPQVPRTSLVVNKVRDPEEGLLVARRFIKVAREHLQLKVDYAGFVLEDENVSLSVRRQKPVVMLYPNSYASVCINNIVAGLFDSPPPEIPANRPGFIERLAGLFRRA